MSRVKVNSMFKFSKNLLASSLKEKYGESKTYVENDCYTDK